MIIEVNIVGNEKGWWIDTRTTSHISNDRTTLKNYETVGARIELFMGNLVTSNVMEKCDVELQFTLKKIVTLKNVLYVLEVRKNFVSRYLLNKHGFRMVFKFDKFILSKNGTFVSKWYATNEMFKLNVMEIKSVFPIIYLIDSLDMWHARLGRTSKI